jgi:hypothetical protein
VNDNRKYLLTSIFIVVQGFMQVVALPYFNPGMIYLSDILLHEASKEFEADLFMAPDYNSARLFLNHAN